MREVEGQRGQESWVRGRNPKQMRMDRREGEEGRKREWRWEEDGKEWSRKGMEIEHK